MNKLGFTIFAAAVLLLPRCADVIATTIPQVGADITEWKELRGLVEQQPRISSILLTADRAELQKLGRVCPAMEDSHVIL